jgi:ATP-dependent DNA helicase RecQ
MHRSIAFARQRICETEFAAMANLSELLHSTFGFRNFRANQEAVCRAATDGHDVLLVMPTGAGKSLCYQLPAIARGGTALVVSPLIALMDDQANKLAAAGLRVARIHSGLSRDQARQACRDYLDGNLQFLFIAPERMRVPGFPEMLAKRKPALIAIDEAHCISAWGHDFRPDYRTLGEHLPALRPAPIVALTATATPAVQQDIVTQLNLDRPALFIHGFRRDNLHIEVVELSKPRRTEFTRDFLSDKSRRPAIVYAPSRKAAEELAGELGRRFPAAAYHAGLDPGTRERVQRHFLSGKLEVVVATIAFGMGIDKADVRTVIHIALPASVEAYYQEIGRAGRDGLPSRTVLLYTYADRKMHDFFLDRDYPVATELTRVSRALTDEHQPLDLLAHRLKMDMDVVAKSVEKLAGQGAAQIDMAGQVRRIPGIAWQSGYEQQVQFRRSQIDRIMEYAQTPQCRMTALIRHFGDCADASKPCGHCDFCAPASAAAQTFREPSSSEDRSLRAVLRALDGSMGRSTGKLFTDLGLTKERHDFDLLLDGLARAGLLQTTSETFTNGDGKTISFKKASLTFEGQTLAPGAPLGVMLSGGSGTSSNSTRQTRKSSRGSASGTQLGQSGEAKLVSLTAEQDHLATQLRAWRKAEAAKTGKPAFLVFPETALTALALEAPQSLAALLRVSGFGQERVDKYGADLITICRGTPATTSHMPSAVPVPPQPVSPQPGPVRQAIIKPVRPKPGASVDAAAQTKQLPSAATVVASGGATPGMPTLRPGPPVDPATLSPEQQAIEQRLRDWRKIESEKMGLPQFFVLGTTALRHIVVRQPRTLADLRAIDGIGPDKLERFGASILAACQQGYNPATE